MGREARRQAHRREGHGRQDGEGILRIDFAEPDDKLKPIPWEEFFETFEDRKLAFLHQDKTADGKKSNFNKLIGRETAEAREHGESHASRHHPRGRK